MDGFGPRAPGGLKDVRDHEVRLVRGARANVVRLVGETCVHGIGIEVGVDGHRSDIEIAAPAHHPHRDLAAVGDEQFPEHGSVSYVGHADAIP